MFTALHDFTPDDLQKLFILEGLATIEKIQIIIALLPDEDLQRLRNIIQKLEAKKDGDVSTRIAVVKATFGLN